MRRAVAALVGTVLILIGLTAPANGAVSSTISGWISTSMRAAVGYAVSDGVTVKTGTSYPARTVQLQRRPATATTWTTLATAKTTTTGAYTARYSVPATGTWYFRIYAPATSTATSAVTAARKVVGIRGAPTSIAGWVSAAASGAVGYAISDAVTVKTGTSYPTRTIQLQRRPATSTTWTTLATGTTTSGGAYTARYSVPGTGTWYFRLYAPATTTAAAAATTARKITGIAGATTTITGWPTTAATGAIGCTFANPITIKTGTGHTTRTVTIQRRLASTSTWTTITTATTGATGTYTASHSVPATGTWYYRLVAPATTTAAAATTAQRAITGITGTPTTITGWDTTPSTLEAGQSLTAAARVQTGTGYTSRTVQVQRRLATATTWTTVMTGTSNSLGGYTATLPVPAAGTWYFRLVAPATMTAAAATTATRTITARPALVWAPNHEFEPRSGGMDSVACPTTSFCMAVDEAGQALTYNGNTWSAPRKVAGIELFTAVSCATATYCVAGDGAGRSTTYNGSTWSAPRPASATGYIRKIDCPSTSLCFAIGNSNDIYTFDGTTWSSATRIAKAGTLIGISCPTISFCMVIDINGQAAVLDGNTYTWSSATATGLKANVADLSCSSAAFCAAITEAGYASVLTDFTWSAPVRIDQLQLSALSCPSVDFCVALDWSGRTLLYRAGAWSSPIDTPGASNAVACPLTTFCVAVSQATATTYDGTQWSPAETVDPYPGRWSAASCAADHFCIAVSSNKDFSTYDGSSWSRPAPAGVGAELVSISCPLAGYCIAIGVDANTYTYDGTRWIPTVSPPYLQHLTCAAAAMCIAANGPNVYQWTGGGWSEPANVFGQSGYVTAADCVNSTFCAAADGLGRVATYDGRRWTIAPATFTPALNNLSCATPTYCVGINDNRFVTYNGQSWSASRAGAPDPLRAVSCPTTTYCAASSIGGVYAFDGTTSRATADSPKVGGPIDCPTADMCLVLDEARQAIVGRRS